MSEPMIENKALMAQARDRLRGRWGLGVAVTAVYFAILIAVTSIPSAGGLISLLIGGPMGLGLTIVFLAVHRGQPADVGQLFHGFRRYGVVLGAYLLIILFVVLWAVLLIVPGIIALMAYSMTLFIIAEDDSAGPLEAITRSKEMMRGHKWRFFLLNLRFIGWLLLSALSCGVGLLWFYPYIITTYAGFYDDLKGRAGDAGGEAPAGAGAA